MVVLFCVCGCWLVASSGLYFVQVALTLAKVAMVGLVAMVVLILFWTGGHFGGYFCSISGVPLSSDLVHGGSLYGCGPGVM